jgi:hypothetical protein
MQEIPKSWSVLFTKNKTEILVTERLKFIGFETYAKTIIRQWRERKKTVKLPLLPSMVLLSVTPKNFYKVFDIAGVIRYLFIDGQKAEVRQKEIYVMKYYHLKNTILKKLTAVVKKIEVPHLGV